MEDKVTKKLTYKIEYLIHKRHRSIRHIQKGLSNEGVFWMNCVWVDKKMFSSIIMQ